MSNELATKPKLCICQLCSCGRHRCTQKVRRLQPCDCTTIYRNSYTNKPLVPTKSCKPDQSPLQTEGPAEDKTTNRLDYVRHPWIQPYVHPREPYLPPQAPAETLTSYRKEYTRMPMNPPKLCQPKPRRVVGEFSGQSTNRIDFQRWPMQPIYHHIPDSYQPPVGPFDGASSYRTSYRGAVAPVRPSMKPSNSAVQSASPIDDLTTSRMAYIHHPMPDRPAREPQEWRPNPAAIDGLTNYRKEYTLKGDGRRLSCKPDNSPTESDAPFDGTTTQRSDFTTWPVKRPEAHRPDEYQPPQSPMATQTTNRVVYTRKPLDKTPSCRPTTRVRPVGSFEGLTTTKADYRTWGRVERPPMTMRDKYEPIVEPFEGLPLYRSSYVHHNEPRRPSMKPPEIALQSNAPLQDKTEYRNEFTRKPLEPCLAAMLQAGARCGVRRDRTATLSSKPTSSDTIGICGRRHPVVLPLRSASWQRCRQASPPDYAIRR